MSQKDYWVNLYRVQARKIERVSNRTERKSRDASREIGASSEFQRAQLWHKYLKARVQICAICTNTHVYTLNLARSSSLRWLYEILLSLGNLPYRFGQTDVFLYFPNARYCKLCISIVSVYKSWYKLILCRCVWNFSILILRNILFIKQDANAQYLSKILNKFIFLARFLVIFWHY